VVIDIYQGSCYHKINFFSDSAEKDYSLCVGFNKCNRHKGLYDKTKFIELSDQPFSANWAILLYGQGVVL